MNVQDKTRVKMEIGWYKTCLFDNRNLVWEYNVIYSNIASELNNGL